MWVYLNGVFVPDRDAVVSIHDRGFRYGDGVFETIRVYEGQPLFCEAHLDRLLRGTRVLGFSGLPSRERLVVVVRNVIDRNGLLAALLRITVTRGVSEGWESRPDVSPTMVIVERPYSGYPDEMYVQGASVVVLDTTRIPASALDPTIKSLNALPQVQAKREAMARGAHEAILCTETGLVAEGSVSNVFCVEAGRIKTPPVSAGILPGITRAIVMDLARREGFPCDEALFTPDELHHADEIFLTGTGMDVLPVTSVDGRTISAGRPGTVTSALGKLYQGFIRASLAGARSSPLE